MQETADKILTALQHVIKAADEANLAEVLENIQGKLSEIQEELQVTLDAYEDD